jgi:hypothetical protein
MITIQKVTGNVQSVPHQSPDIDTPNCVLEDRVQYSTVHIPNVFFDGHLWLINCVGIVRIQFFTAPQKKNGAEKEPEILETRWL